MKSPRIPPRLPAIGGALAQLCFGLLCVGPAMAESDSSRLNEAIRRAEAVYRLEGRAPGLWADAEIMLLPDREPVLCEAELLRTGPLPGSMRETSRMVRWKTRAGDMRNMPMRDGVTKAIWTLPENSQRARVEVEAWITIDHSDGKAGSTPAIIYKRVRFDFLTPTSSSLMIRGMLDGYEIGEYPDPDDPTLPERFKIESKWHKLHPERYQRPAFFHRIDADMKQLSISPHLTLGHFTIDYPWGSLGMPQYLTIDANLVEKMEDLVALMKAEARFEVTGIVPIYGFRPPAFNLGTISERPEETLKVPFSMHQYGRAIDFIIDEDGDLVLDDLNGDGVHDIHDTVEIMRFVNMLDRQYREEGAWAKVGGAGMYANHDFVGRPQTPYVHVDTRGFQSENNTLVRWAEGWPEGVPLRFGKDSM